jgi:NAD(P)-dependent dehydrogenase (short-subunit alcohol dehydrogenase family)
MPLMGDLSGRRALITGASSGLGRATAHLFAGQGAAVALLSRRESELWAVAREIGRGAIAVAADVADPSQVESAVDEAFAKLGGLDILVNAAGIDTPAPLAELDATTWDRQIAVNLSGSFYVSRRAALKMLAGSGGSIVMVGSELSLVGAPLYAHYCASKAGVIGLTRALAAELAPKIRVNAICPGPINTPMMRAEIDWYPDPDAARREFVDRVPLKRFAEPDEIARAILFLVADAPFATGSVWSIDGGTTAV